MRRQCLLLLSICVLSACSSDATPPSELEPAWTTEIGIVGNGPGAAVVDTTITPSGKWLVLIGSSSDGLKLLMLDPSDGTIDWNVVLPDGTTSTGATPLASIVGILPSGRIAVAYATDTVATRMEWVEPTGVVLAPLDLADPLFGKATSDADGDTWIVGTPSVSSTPMFAVTELDPAGQELGGWTYPVPSPAISVAPVGVVATTDRVVASGSAGNSGGAPWTAVVARSDGQSIANDLFPLADNSIDTPLDAVALNSGILTFGRRQGPGQGNYVEEYSGDGVQVFEEDNAYLGIGSLTPASAAVLHGGGVDVLELSKLEGGLVSDLDELHVGGLIDTVVTPGHVRALDQETVLLTWGTQAMRFDLP